ncbi:MAG: hypothetical protein LBG60_16540 [Bifidobacteriaceae bacterium]|nr:hypothetical protein [Bifidobacteriaceae bacterium]
MPAVIALMVLVLAVGSAAVGQLAAAGAARAGARAAALGQTDSQIEAAAEAVGGGGLTVTVSRSGGLVEVTCQRRLAVPPFGQRLTSAKAVAACEPARGCG